MGHPRAAITRSDADRKCSLRKTACLDYVIPLDVSHLRRILREWTCHYNTGRPHRFLGPGIPDRCNETRVAGHCTNGQQLPSRIIAKAILGGLHHEYCPEEAA
jgi:putative transposase